MANIVAMSGITNDQFLRDKINRFVAFLMSCLVKRLDNSRYLEFEEKIVTLRSLDTCIFILHVTESMCPYRSNVPQYFTRMLAEHDVKPEDLTPAEVTKMCLFVECFIEVVSQ